MPRRNHPRKHTRSRAKGEKRAPDIAQNLDEYGFFEHDLEKQIKICHVGKGKK